MIFANATGITIPEGEVVKITSGGVTLWEKASTPTADYYGTVTASGDSYITLNANDNLGTSFEYVNLLVVRQGSTSDGTIVTKIENGVVTFGDGSTSNNFTTSFPGVNFATGLTISNVTNEADEECFFAGTYDWQFDKV